MSNISIKIDLNLDSSGSAATSLSTQGAVPSPVIDLSDISAQSGTMFAPSPVVDFGQESKVEKEAPAPMDFSSSKIIGMQGEIPSPENNFSAATSDVAPAPEMFGGVFSGGQNEIPGPEMSHGVSGQVSEGEAPHPEELDTSEKKKQAKK